MSFKTGDRVKFLNDVGGGIVVRVVKQTAYVETEDGFEIPSLFSELLKVEQVGFGDMKPAPTETSVKQQNTSKNIPIVEEFDDVAYKPQAEYSTIEEEDDEIITTENSTLNVILGMVPVKKKGKFEPDFDVYLISDCAYRFMYTFSIVRDNFVHGYRAGLIEEDTKLHIGTFSASELKELQTFKLNCIFYKKGVYLPHEPLIYEYKIEALSMVDPANWEENDYFDEKAIIVNVTEMSLIYEIERMITQTEDKYIIQKKRRDTIIPKKAAPKKTNADLEEIDLHIEELVENHSGMSAGEIMELQMSRFTIALDGAIRNNIKRIVFIHGVGAGKLKYEITKTLERKYPKLRFQDASFKEYGYGATMVILKG